MRERIMAAAKRHRERCGELVRELIAIPSLSRHEDRAAQHVRRQMHQLGYPSAHIDRFGNVVGRIGEGPTRIVFDAHMDTTGIGDRSSWRFDPYEGDFKANKVYGHGAANNKGGLAAVIHAGAIMHELGLTEECSVFIVGSIQTEECEGLAYKAIFDVERLAPHFVVLSMPTGMRICHGHRGRAELRITLRGQPVHASTPRKGFNAIYGMAKIIAGVRELDDKLPQDGFLGRSTVAVTHIECDDNGPNQLVESCRIVVDRRFGAQENTKKIIAQLREICRGTRAKIEVVEYDQPSYRGLRLPMEKFFPAWQLPAAHPLMVAAESAYRSVFRKKPALDCWTMSTAGSYTMGIGKVPTIGMGPSEESFQGPVNDHVRLDDLERSMGFYASLLGHLPDREPSRPRRRR